VSGVVVGVNEALTRDPSTLQSEPCGQGWIACVCTTRLEEEVKNCRARCVVLANADDASAGAQGGQLAALGCQVRRASSWEELASAVAAPEWDVLVLDAASFGQEGPALARQINQAAPSVKLVVVATSASNREAEYRERKIFYYAVEPFVDGEIAEIVDAAFRRQITPPPKPHNRPSEPVASIGIINRNRTKVRLIAEPGLLEREYGLGGEIRRRLAARMFPVATTPGEARMSPTEIVKAARACDRLMVLAVKDTGRLPGSLVRNTKAEFGSVAGETTSKVTTLDVQPDPIGGGLAGLDDRTMVAIAEHIAQEMASY
jgi:CheY-like chemotaxis protein